MNERAPDTGRSTLGASALLSCAYFAAIGAFNPYAPLWFKELGLSVFAIGVLVSLQSWTRLFAPYAWGALADRSGQRVWIIRVAALASFVAGAGFLLPVGPLGLGLVVFLMFSFNAAIVPLTETVVAARITDEQGNMDARRYGRVRVWGSVGFLASVVLAGWWYQWLGLRVFAATTLVLLSLVVLAAWRLPMQRVRRTEQGTAAPIASVLRRPEVAWFFAGLFLTVLAHSALYAFFSLYLIELGYGKGMVGLLWAVSVGVEIAWFAFQGRLMESASLHRWLLVSALLTALRFAVTAAFGQSLLLLMLAQCLHALTFAVQHTACIALITRYFPGPLRGRGQALYSVLGYGFSGVLGGLGGGWLAQHAGYASVFWAASAMGLLGALCCWRSMRWHEQGSASA
jgi:PPP family 3-phenylpropionic acid transporter